LSLGYAMTVDEAVLPARLKRVMGVVVKVSVVLVVIGFFVYLSNFESRSLAQKYGMRIYAKDQDRDGFAGFFEPSKRWKYGDYRWFSERGAIKIDAGRRTTEDGSEGQSSKIEGERSKVKGEREKGQRTEDGGQKAEDRGRWTESGRKKIGLEFYCLTPGLEEEPVVLKVSYGGRVLDEVVFEGKVSKKGERSKVKGQTVRREYELPVGDGDGELILEVSRTWIPHEHLGNFDRRKLGIGVKVLPDK